MKLPWPDNQSQITKQHIHAPIYIKCVEHVLYTMTYMLFNDMHTYIYICMFHFELHKYNYCMLIKRTLQGLEL